jgi:hypothetical protein
MGFKRHGKKFNISDRRRQVLDVDNHIDRDGAGPEVLKSAYIESTNSSMFSFVDGRSDTPFSVSIWFNVPSFTVAEGYKILVGKFDFNGIAGQPALPNTGSIFRANEWFLTLSTGSANLTGGLFLYDPDQPEVVFAVDENGNPIDRFAGGGNSGSQLRRFRNMSSLVQVGQWHHFCATYTGNPDFGPPPTTSSDQNNLVDSGIELFMDGVNIGGTEDRVGFYSSMISRAAPLTIGSGADADTVARGNNFPFFGEGKLSDCSIFDKSLSASEVLELYEAGRGFDIQEFSAASSVVSHFPLGNGDTLTSGGIKDTVGVQHGSPAGQHASDGLNIIVERV